MLWDECICILMICFLLIVCFFFFGYYIKVVFEVLFVVGGFIEMGDEGF